MAKQIIKGEEAVLVREREEPATRGLGLREGTESLVGGPVSRPDLVEHSRAHDDVLDGLVLQEIELVESDVGVDDDVLARLVARGESSGLGRAVWVQGRPRGDVVAEVVFSDDFDDGASAGLFHERLLLEHFLFLFFDVFFSSSMPLDVVDDVDVEERKKSEKQMRRRLLFLVFSLPSCSFCSIFFLFYPFLR